MGRRPADEIARAPKPVGRDAIWAAVRRVPGGTAFSVIDIRRETDANEATIRGYLKALEASGRLATAEAGPPRRWRLARDTGRETPRVRPDGAPVTMGDGNQRMWRAMKLLKQFTATDLALAASPPGAAPVSFETAESYVRWLHRAGYLRMRSVGTDGAQTIWLFARDTGPLAPMLQRAPQVFDPNLNEVVYRATPRGRAS